MLSENIYKSTVKYPIDGLDFPNWIGEIPDIILPYNYTDDIDKIVLPYKYYINMILTVNP
jgi:hypothetical protein